MIVDRWSTFAVPSWVADLAPSRLGLEEGVGMELGMAGIHADIAVSVDRAVFPSQEATLRRRGSTSALGRRWSFSWRKTVPPGRARYHSGRPRRWQSAEHAQVRIV